MAESRWLAIAAGFFMRRPNAARMLLAGVAIQAAAGCAKPPVAAFAPPPASVITADVKTAEVPVYLDEIGRTVATEVVNVLPQVSGKITEIHFKDGSDLKKGEVLFILDQRPFQAQLDAALATEQQNKAKLDYAQKEFDRMKSLMSTKAVSAQDLDTAQSNYDIAAADVKSSAAAIETAKLNLEYCTITAPTDGRAGHRLVDAGNVVNANQTALLGIQKIAPIYVDFTVTESDLPRVRQNIDRALQDQDKDKRFLAAEIYNADAQGTPILGKLTFLDNAVQDGTGTIKVRATVDNEGRLLWPGQFVRVRLILQTLKNALLVPNDAIQVGQQGSFVFVAKLDGPSTQPAALIAQGGPPGAPAGSPGAPAMPAGPVATIEQRPVSTGQRQGDMIVVEKGLTAGEKVVTAGQLMLMPGAKVMLVPDATKTPVQEAAQQ